MSGYHKPDILGPNNLIVVSGNGLINPHTGRTFAEEKAEEMAKLDQQARAISERIKEAQLSSRYNGLVINLGFARRSKKCGKCNKDGKQYRLRKEPYFFICEECYFQRNPEQLPT